MNPPRSDALVFFGASGDLAYKQIFPALQALMRRGRLDEPIIAVARSGWTLDQLRARARESIEKHGSIDEDAFAKLSRQLLYIDGDYNSPETFGKIHDALNGAQRPAHYLAIPPSVFPVVIESLARADCAENARVILEKPFHVAELLDLVGLFCGLGIPAEAHTT